GVATVVGAATLLAGPAAYSLTTVRHPRGGALVSAGPTSVAGALVGGAEGGGSGDGFGGATTTDGSALIAFPEATQGNATYLVATFGSQSSASIIIASGKPVMTIGGFNGGDPAPTLAQFEELVARGKVRYVLIGGGGGAGGIGGGGFGGGPRGGGSSI